ncbi:MAG TPA: hypothetical protein VIH29_01430, partial [Gallionella sp.]
GISDLALESHDSLGVMLFTYAVMTVPVRVECFSFDPSIYRAARGTSLDTASPTRDERKTSIAKFRGTAKCIEPHI